MKDRLKNASLPIGVFDSGIGGLTVVKEIMSLLPNEEIIYFGDTARLPYGSKSKETILAYSKQIVRFLLSGAWEEKGEENDACSPLGVKAIVIACNTASALALDEVAKKVTIPVLGVVKPGARVAIETTKNGRIGIIAIEGTIKSNIYKSIIENESKKLFVHGKACPLFVPLVEEGWKDSEVAKQVVDIYLEELKKVGVDTLVLGCTHYPILREVIQSSMGEEVVLVNPALETARSLKEVLETNGILQTEKTKHPHHRFFVSDGEDKFRQFANSILPNVKLMTTDVNRVELGEFYLREE